MASINMPRTNLFQFVRLFITPRFLPRCHCDSKKDRLRANRYRPVTHLITVAKAQEFEHSVFISSLFNFQELPWFVFVGATGAESDATLRSHHDKFIIPKLCNHRASARIGLASETSTGAGCCFGLSCRKRTPSSSGAKRDRGQPSAQVHFLLRVLLGHCR